jgi:nucleoid DNA-binding protein
MNKVELIEELRTMDEVTLLELLEVDAQDLIDAFIDKITENQSKLIKFVNDN